MSAAQRILVVDDSDDNREAVAELLSANGYFVDKAGSSQEAFLNRWSMAPTGTSRKPQGKRDRPEEPV